MAIKPKQPLTMKYALFLLLLPLICGAQKPEQIYPFARYHYSAEYLKKQAELWKEETERSPSNANAWYNYFYANRNLYLADTTRAGREKQWEKTGHLLDTMARSIPESYEYNLCRWQHGGWNMKLISYLRKAQELGPDRTEHLDFSIVLAEIDNDTKARDKWSRKKKEAGQFSSGLLYYNYNVLTGLPDNALLLTSGDNDTYPVWYLQSQGIRPDVTIVHTQLIHLKEYRDALLSRLKVSAWEGETPPWASEGNEHHHKENIVTWLCGKTKRPLYVALTASARTRSAPAEHMYLTGLAYAYSMDSFDNLAVLRRNFEQQYALDYIDKPFFDDISADLVRTVNGNYVVPMLKLYEHYRASGEERNAQKMKSLLLSIVKDTPSEDELKKKLAGI